MAKRRAPQDDERKLIEIAILYKHPNSPQADAILDKIAASYDQAAQRRLATAGLMFGSKWIVWFRILQVRVINAVCSDRPDAEAAVRRLLPSRPPVGVLMREALRSIFIELNGVVDGSGGPPPKEPRAYWDEAFDSLVADIERWERDKVVIDENATEHFQILGADYNLSFVEWMSATASDD